jgi:transglutaminase/protease-like cytokinesis protein 3
LKIQAITTTMLLFTTFIFNACGMINDSSNSISFLLGCRNANKSGDNIAVTDVTLNKNNSSIHIANTEQLTATIIPADATNQNVTWSSSDENIATVDLNGIVTTVATGAATITVTTADGGYTASCEVTVIPSFMPKSSPRHKSRGR